VAGLIPADDAIWPLLLLIPDRATIVRWGCPSAQSKEGQNGHHDDNQTYQINQAIHFALLFDV